LVYSLELFELVQSYVGNACIQTYVPAWDPEEYAEAASSE